MNENIFLYIANWTKTNYRLSVSYQFLPRDLNVFLDCCNAKQRINFIVRTCVILYSSYYLLGLLK